MSDRVPLRRPHPRSLLVRAAIVMRSAWLVVGFGVTLTAARPSAWDTVLMVVLVYYGYTRLVQVFSGWCTVRYAANRRGITVLRGLVGREEKRLPWRSVVSVTVGQTLVQRTFGVADLRITLRASEMASVTIQDLLTGEAARLVRLHRQSRVERATPGLLDPGQVLDVAPIVKSEPGRVVTPPLRPSDFVLIGVCTGAFVFFLPSVYSAASEILPWFGLSRTVLPSVREIARLDPVVSGLAVGIVAVGSLVYGSTVAWVRYRGFSVTCSPSGELVFAAGLAQREQRVVVSEDVAAYEFRRPVLMLLGNRVVLRAVVRGGSGLVTRNLLLPLTRMPQAVEMLRFLTGLPSADLVDGSRRTRALPVVLVAVAGSLLLATVVSVTLAPLALVAVAAAFLLLRAADSHIGHIRVATSASGGRWVIAQRGTLFRSVWVVRADSVDVSRWVGFSRQRGTQTVTLRGRHTVRLTVWPASARLAALLRRELDSSTPLTLERNPR